MSNRQRARTHDPIADIGILLMLAASVAFLGYYLLVDIPQIRHDRAVCEARPGMVYWYATRTNPSMCVQGSRAGGMNDDAD